MVVNESYRPLTAKQATLASIAVQLNEMREKLVYIYVMEYDGSDSEIDEKIANIRYHIDQIQKQVCDL